MRLSHKTTVKLNKTESRIIDRMCYAAYKLWNICNYERKNWKELGLKQYPDWYCQKKIHKDEYWYKSLPSQSAQEVCKLLDKSWKSYYSLLKSGGIENPQPPYFKHSPIAITYMQNGIKHEARSEEVRLSLPNGLKKYLLEAYGGKADFLFLHNRVFSETDMIKQIKLYPPRHGETRVIVIYETENVIPAEENGKYLSIDPGLHNLFTCYDSGGASFIVGRNYLNICYRYDKKIARVQSQWSSVQSAAGVEHPKSSRHIRKIQQKKKNTVDDYLHKVTAYIADYCVDHDIRTVVIGDIRNIRKGKDLGHAVNQKLHSLPYAKMYLKLEYKLALKGIRMEYQNEAYSSQCGPFTKEVSAEYARKRNRAERGLYIDGNAVYNADALGAYNILRKYLIEHEKEPAIPVNGLSELQVIKAAV